MFKSQSSTQIAESVRGLNKSGMPVVEIQHYAAAGAGLARFVARVVHTAASRANPQLIAESLKSKFNGQLQAVAGSVNVVDRGPVSETITGMLSVVRESVAIASSEDLKGFTAVAANMYLDDEERMWTLNTTTAGNIMVRTTGIDDDQALVGLLHAVASSTATSGESQRMSALASAVRSKVEGGKFVSYVNQHNELVQGFIVAVASDDAELAVALPVDGEPEQININAVTEVHNISDDVLPELSEDEQIQVAVASARGSVNIDMILDYYKKVFVRSPDYFAEFAKRVRGHQFCC